MTILVNVMLAVVHCDSTDFFKISRISIFRLKGNFVPHLETSQWRSYDPKDKINDYVFYNLAING